MFLLMLILSCSKSRNKIEGTWTHIKTTVNEEEIIRPEQEGHLEQIEYLENGEMKYYHDNKRYGLGYYYYRLKGDSLYQTNVQVDTTGGFDTLGTQGVLFSIRNDTMTIKQDSKTIYYKKEKD